MPTQSTLPGSANTTTGSSAASTKSENGTKPLSSSAASRHALGRASSVKERATSAPTTLAMRSPAKKSMSSFLTGLFGSKDGADASKASREKAVTAKLPDRSKEAAAQDKASSLPSTSAPASNASTSPPPSMRIAPTGDAPSSSPDKTTDAAAAGGSSHSNSKSPSQAPSADGKDKDKNSKLDDPNGHPRRFYLTDDETTHHEHHLKSARRHQKIRDMVRHLYKKKDPANGNDDQPLTLIADWIKQKQAERASPDLTGNPEQTQTLVQKWGKCQDIVGHGAFGIVRMASKNDPTDAKPRLVAIKEFHKRPSENPKHYQKRVNAEFCLLKSLQHPNVIQALDLMPDAKGDYCEVMEYCAGGDLYTLILSAGNLEVMEADCYFKQLMRGVEYMHEMGVAHRDLKPENLLLTSHGALKITDFGNGECFRMAWEKEAHMTAGLCGSGPYIAPEEYVDKEFDPRKVDVWACGVIYMAMRQGRHLWRVAQKGEDEFFTRYLEDRKKESGFRPIEQLRRRQCRNVIYSVLDPNPSRRLTASQVLRSEWASSIRVCRAGEEGA